MQGPIASGYGRDLTCHGWQADFLPRQFTAHWGPRVHARYLSADCPQLAASSPQPAVPSADGSAQPLAEDAIANLVND